MTNIKVSIMKFDIKDLIDIAETRKIPDGFNIKVVRKEDILSTIDKNILDKDVALEVISHCEISAINFFKNGYWASIPYMGNFRLDPRKVIRNQALKELDAGAKTVLDDNDVQDKARYILFRKQVSNDAREKINFLRYYNYCIALGSNKNPKAFRKLCRNKGIYMARLLTWGLMRITPIDNRFEYIYAEKLNIQYDD